MAERRPIARRGVSFSSLGNQEVSEEVLRQTREAAALDILRTITEQPGVEQRLLDLALQLMRTGQRVGGQTAVVVDRTAKQDPPELRHHFGAIAEFRFRSAPAAKGLVGEIGLSSSGRYLDGSLGKRWPLPGMNPWRRTPERDPSASRSRPSCPPCPRRTPPARARKRAPGQTPVQATSGREQPSRSLGRRFYTKVAALRIPATWKTRAVRTELVTSRSYTSRPTWRIRSSALLRVTVPSRRR